jgi:DNA-binding response OmpR family regulator
MFADREAERDAASSGAPMPQATSPRVLVVDDDEGMRFALEAGLTAHGFVVDAVPDAPTACRLAGELRPDLVLLDSVIPGGDGGADACRCVRAAHPGAAVVMLTGLADDADRAAALDAGASAYLVKGIQLEMLVERLRELL